MDFHLHAYAAVLGVVFVAQGLLDGLDARPGRAEYHGMPPRLRPLGVEQVCVDGLPLLVERQFHKVAVDFVGAVFVGFLLCVGQGESPHFLYPLAPEGREVGRLFCRRAYVAYRVAHLYVVLVGLAANYGFQAQVAEARRRPRAHVDDGAAAHELGFALAVDGHHVVGRLVSHGAVQGHSVPVQLHLHLGFLALVVEPVGVVGHGHPQHVRAVGIVLSGGVHGDGHGREQQCK